MALPPAEDGRVPVRRPGTPGPRGGGVYLSRMQQTRLLDAAIAIVAEDGMGWLTARTVSARAGMSTKTFYDLFENSEDCFLAVFDRAVEDLVAAAAPAWVGEGEWVARVRAALAVLLAYLDRDPELCRVVFVEALAAGSRVLERRASVLDEVARAVDEGRAGSAAGAELPSLTAAGVTGAAFSLIHAQLLDGESAGSLLELLGPLMATIVLPYRGREASAGELERPVPETLELPERRVSSARPEFLRTGHATRPASTPRATSPRAKRRSRVAAGKPARARRPGARQVPNGGALPARGETVDGRRVRLLRAAVEMVDEHGYAAVTVGDIAGCAKISRRTFYEMFTDREDCLLAALREIDAQITSELQAAGIEGLQWRERVRQGLWTVLRFFDREPGLARFCIVHSARGEERIAAYRERLLARITDVILEGREESLLAESSPLVAEGIAGAIVSILNTRLSHTGCSAGRPSKETPPIEPVSDLFGELMALLVFPYLGAGLAQEERTRPAPAHPAAAPLSVPEPGSNQGGKYLVLDPDPSPAPQLRMTYRTALVLEAIAQAPGISNLGVARHAQVNDQGQISKLLSRLERNGLVQNTGRGQTRGAPNEWRLTREGQKLEQNIREHEMQAA